MGRVDVTLSPLVPFSPDLRRACANRRDILVCPPLHPAEWPLPSPLLPPPPLPLRKYRNARALCAVDGEQEREVERSVIEIDET